MHELADAVHLSPSQLRRVFVDAYGKTPMTYLTTLRAERLIEERGFTVLAVPHEGMIHGANGMTDYTAKALAVRENMDPAAQVKTLAHELGHVLLHGPDQEDARQHRGIGEVEAESVALMIGAAHHMDTTGYTIPYVSTWAARVDGKEPVEIVKATGERVRKTALAILDQLDTAQVGDGTPPGLDRETPQRNQPSQEWTALARSASGRQVKPVPETVPRPAASAAVMQGRGL